MLWDEVEGWDGGVGGRLKKEGLYVYIWQIHVVVQQKLMQHCRVIYSNKKHDIFFLKHDILIRNYKFALAEYLNMDDIKNFC